MEKKRFLSLVLLLTLLVSQVFGFGGYVSTAKAASILQAPLNLRVPALAYDEKSITLVWNKPVDYSNITDYNIYMNGTKIGKASDNASEAYSNIKKFYAENSPAQKTTIHNYTAAGLQPNTKYSFTVRSADADGNESLDSNVVIQSTAAIPKVFNIEDYGAVGDGTTINTNAIQAAIDDCTPGGKVLIPAGRTGSVFKSGAIFLKSDMTLEIAEGATLSGSDKASDYPFNYLMYEYYYYSVRYYSLINAHTYDYGSLKNIRIVGKGTIDGNGWKQNGTHSGGVSGATFPNSVSSSSSTVTTNGILAKNQYNSLLNQINPVTGEPYTTSEAYDARSNIFTLRGVENVYLADFKAVNPADHTVTTVQCTNLTANGLRLETYDCNNGDGLGFANGNGLIAMNIVFDTGDDCMNFGAGFGRAGENDSPTENAWVFNNYFSEGHGAIVAGSHTAAWIHNVVAEDNIMVNTDVGLRLKNNPANGGGAYNILFRDNAMKAIGTSSNKSTAFIFTSKYTASDDVKFEPAAGKAWFHDIIVKNCTVDMAGISVPITFESDGTINTPHENIIFDNVKFTNVAYPTAINYLKNSTFNNITFKDSSGNDFPGVWNITNSTGLSFTGSTTQSTNSTGSVNAASAPAWPSDSTLTAVADQVYARLDWTPATDNIEVTNYDVINSDDGTIIGTVAGNVYTYKVEGLSPDLPYKFKVEARDATGNRTSTGPICSVATIGTRDIQAPVAPTGSNAITISKNTSNDDIIGSTWVGISWTPATDTYGIKNYEIYANGRKVGTVTGTVYSYLVTKLTPVTQYVFTVKAIDAAKNAATYASSISAVTAPPYDASVPKWRAGSTITASELTETSVKLSWTKAADDKAIAGYRIYKDGKPIQGDVKFTPVNSACTITDSVYSITGLTPNTTYTFNVEAGDTSNKWTGSGPSLTITTLGIMSDYELN